MRDTSPAAKKPPDERRPAPRGDKTWYEDSAKRPDDEPLIALLPLPESRRDSS